MMDAPAIDWRDARVIDGDTFAIGAQRYRLADIDAPELHGACRAERMLATLAAEQLRAVLSSPPGVIVLDLEGLDRYGRRLTRVIVNGDDVGETMVLRGYAVRWEGRRASWCLQD